MKKRRKANASAATRKPDARQPVAAVSSPSSRRKLWCFRLLAAMGVPLVAFVLLELILRFAGYGYPTSFLLPELHNGKELLVQNNRFGWRFFGPQLARKPYPLAISPRPAPDTVRIIVFGESAAKGDPDPHFGLPRMLEATLSLRHPGTRFEVVNAAMTAINSHAVRLIARDCAKLEADVWVVYLGNNEVVGPFGAGTVFGPQTPPLALIRSALAVKATRTGQWLDSLMQVARRSPTEIPEWGGMEMFLDQQVRADDPQMNGVYRHFERNLADLLQLGEHAGVGVVLSTVAVDLKDCAPFASAHRAGFSSTEKSRWDELYRQGAAAQRSGRFEEALSHFGEAAKLDDSFAELRFRQGQCLLALGRGAEAEAHFAAARDYDTLRFRCDARLNELTRQAASNREPAQVRLADAERVFAEHSADGLPGAELFYEHVHLTFVGNHLLARTIAKQVEQMLAGRLTPPPSVVAAWPSGEDCARRLGWSDWAKLTGWKGILPRLRNPPFTGQFDHSARMERVEEAMRALSAALPASSLTNALAICEGASAAATDDAALLPQLAALRQRTGNLAGAVIAARKYVELLPSDGEGWERLGQLLARQQKHPEAALAFERAVQLDAQDAAALEQWAQTLAALGQTDQALRKYQQVLEGKPKLALAWLHQGQLLEQLKRVEESAISYQNAFANAGRSLPGLLELAGFAQRRGWFEAAATNYIAALDWDAGNAELYLGAGQNLSALGRQPEAIRYAAEAVRLAPEFAEAHLLQGLILGRMGRLPEAETAFRTALRLKPDFEDARYNLGVALRDRNPAEALSHFEEVLRRNPAHAAALQQAQRLRTSGSLR